MPFNSLRLTRYSAHVLSQNLTKHSSHFLNRVFTSVAFVKVVVPFLQSVLHQSTNTLPSVRSSQCDQRGLSSTVSVCPVPRPRSGALRRNGLYALGRIHLRSGGHLQPRFPPRPPGAFPQNGRARQWPLAPRSPEAVAVVGR